MKNILKLCLIMALCVGLLLIAGCKKDADTKDTTPATTQPGTQPQGTGNPEGDIDGNAGGQEDVDNDVNQNPEGDPFDGEVPGETNADGNPIPGIDSGSDATEEDDFVVDAGELLGGN